MAGAPNPTVNPRDLFITGTGALFDDETPYAAAGRQLRLDPRPQAPATPYIVKEPSPPRTAYAPLAHQHRSPNLSPQLAASCYNFNSAALSGIALPSPAQPTRRHLNVTTNVQQNAGLGIQQSPRAPQALQVPGINVLPEDHNAVVERWPAGAWSLQRELSDSMLLHTPPAAGSQRHPNSSPARRSAPYAMSAASHTAMQRSFPSPAMSSAQTVDNWLPDPYTVGDHSLGQVMHPPSLGPNRPSAPDPPPQSRPSRTSRSSARSTASNNGPYYCTHPTCKRPYKAYGTKSELEKHAKIHRPKSERKHGCRCGKRFWELKDLHRHEETHTGDKVKCEVCHEWLSRHDNLKRHMEVVHSDRVPPTTPSIMTASSPSMITASSPALSFAARSDHYSPTIPSSPPSLGTPSFPPSGSRNGMPRHSSFHSAQGSPLQYKYRPGYSEAMEKSQSNGS